MAVDPIRVRRARWARLAAVGKRAGYGLVLLAIAAFAVGAGRGFDPLFVGIVTASLLGTTVTLAPAIVLDYAVKKAEREDPQGPARPDPGPSSSTPP